MSHIYYCLTFQKPLSNIPPASIPNVIYNMQNKKENSSNEIPYSQVFTNQICIFLMYMVRAILYANVSIYSQISLLKNF